MNHSAEKAASNPSEKPLPWWLALGLLSSFIFFPPLLIQRDQLIQANLLLGISLSIALTCSSTLLSILEIKTRLAASNEWQHQHDENVAFLLDLQKRIHHLEGELQSFEQSVANSKTELEEQLIKEKHTNQSLIFTIEDAKTEIENLIQRHEGQLEILEQKNSFHISEIQKKESEILKLEQQLRTADKELTHTRDLRNQEQVLHQSISRELNEHSDTISREKVLLEKLLSKLQQQYENLKTEESEKQRQLSELTETLRLVRNESQQHADSLHALEKEKSALLELHASEMKKTEELVEKLKSESALRSQFEGKHKQLREQFKEKSALLDVTRQQLFHTEEQLIALQHVCKEDQLYSLHDETELLMAHIDKVEKEYVQQLKDYEREMEIMQGILADSLDTALMNV